MVAVSDYRQSLQFQNLNEEKQNIHMEVCSTAIQSFLETFQKFFPFFCIIS